jgi:hypothetical protein
MPQSKEAEALRVWFTASADDWQRRNAPADASGKAQSRPASADIPAKVARALAQPISLAPGSLALCSSHRVLIQRSSRSFPGWPQPRECEKIRGAIPMRWRMASFRRQFT